MVTTESIRFSADRTCRFRPITGTGFRLVLELTTCCNLACAHCFVPRASSAIPGDVVDRLLLESAHEGCRKVILTGGEPLLHPDLCRIVARCVELSMLADLNSTLQLDERMAAELAGAGLREASASLYGTPETHAALTRNPTAQERTIHGIRLLRQHGVTVDVHCPLWRGNERDVEYLLSLCERLGCASLTFFSIIRAAGDDAYPISPAAARSAIERLRRRASIPIRSVGFPPCRLDECTMGSAVVGVTAGQAVQPCLLAEPLAGHTASLVRQAFPVALAAVRREVAAGGWRPACTGA